MAIWWAAAAAVIAIVGASESSKDQKEAADEQQRLDRENIKLEEAETEETIKRTSGEQSKVEALAKTQVAYSGFAIGSSLDKYVETMQAEHASDIDWMRTSGASRSAIQHREATARRKISIAKADATMIAGIGSAVGSMAKW
jgi:hypothetical protein